MNVLVIRSMFMFVLEEIDDRADQNVLYFGRIRQSFCELLNTL